MRHLSPITWLPIQPGAGRGGAEIRRQLVFRKSALLVGLLGPLVGLCSVPKRVGTEPATAPGGAALPAPSRPPASSRLHCLLFTPHPCLFPRPKPTSAELSPSRSARFVSTLFPASQSPEVSFPTIPFQIDPHTGRTRCKHATAVYRTSPGHQPITPVYTSQEVNSHEPRQSHLVPRSR